MSTEHQTPEQRLHQWRREIEARANGHARPIKRGVVSGPPAVAATAWRCEGRWQCDEQMDIWQCADEVELDERRRRGETDDEDDED